MAFDPAPPRSSMTPVPEGKHRAVLVDVLYLRNKFKGVAKGAKLRFVWETECLDPDSGEPLRALRDYGYSLGPKSHLRKMLAKWKGQKDMKAEDLAAIRLSTFQRMVGVSCYLEIEHSEREDGSTWAGVEKVTQCPAKDALKPSGLYQTPDKWIEEQRRTFAEDSMMSVPPAVTQPDKSGEEDDADGQVPY